MISKETETFQKSVKHYNTAQSITMMIVSMMIITYFIYVNLDLPSDFNSEIIVLIFFLLMILLSLALFGMIIFTSVWYIQYLVALKAIRSLDPVGLFTKAYRLERTIIKIIIGGIIAGIIMYIIQTFTNSSNISFYHAIYVLTIIPLSLLIFLGLFSRAYIEVVAYLLGYIIDLIELIIFDIKHSSSEELASFLEYALPEILLRTILLCMSILIVISQFKLNRVFFLIKQFIRIKFNSLKIREKVFTFDHLELYIHILAGIALFYTQVVNIYDTTQFRTLHNVYVIIFVIYLSTAVIVFIGAKYWINMTITDRISSVITPTIPTNTQIPVYSLKESFDMSDTGK